MKIVIYDANILIDLAKLDLLDVFSKLNFELHTTDFVYEELNEEQKSPVSSLLENGVLNIIETIALSDFQGINRLLDESNGLSFEDCSVWYYSAKLSGMLLSGDGKLRKQVRKNGIEVRGIIYVFDELIKQNLITFSKGIKKLEQLLQLNSRLPKNEIEKRIKFWSEKKHVG